MTQGSFKQLESLKISVMPDSIRHPEKPASLIRLDSAETLHFVPGLRPLVSSLGALPDIRHRKQPLACHSEGATHTKAKVLKKNTLLHAGKAVATEESRV
jgi:hypothetical protein